MTSSCKIVSAGSLLLVSQLRPSGESGRGGSQWRERLNRGWDSGLTPFFTWGNLSPGEADCSTMPAHPATPPTCSRPHFVNAETEAQNGVFEDEVTPFIREGSAGDRGAGGMGDPPGWRGAVGGASLEVGALS